MRHTLVGRVQPVLSPTAANGSKVFAKLEPDQKIYKLVGPVLVKQERSEAESTVKGRLEFIGKEL